MSIYRCEICGKLFNRVGNGVYCQRPHFRSCPICGKPVEFHRLSDPIKCCSHECTKILTSKIKFGISENSFKSEIIPLTDPQSEFHFEIQQFIESFRFPVVIDYVSDKSYRIFIPKLNIVFDCIFSEYVECYDPVYSDFVDKYGDAKIIPLHESDWVTHHNAVESVIRNAIAKFETRVNVKQLRIEIVDTELAERFIYKNSLCSDIIADLHIGLFSEDHQLFYVVSFHRRKSSESVWDIVSICSRYNEMVHNGFDRVLNHFIRKYQPSMLFAKFRSYDFCVDVLRDYGFVQSNSPVNMNDFVNLQLDPLTTDIAKPCALCGKKFIPEKSSTRVCGSVHYRSCAFCNKPFVIKRPSDSQNCCSKECIENLRKSTMVKRFGVEYAMQNPEIRDKRDSTNLQRYGNVVPAKTDAIKEKIRQHFLDKFGVSTPFLLDDFQDKSYATCMERYGVGYTSQISGRTKKIQDTNLQKYGSVSPIGNPEIRSKIVSTMMDKYGVPYYCMSEDYKQHNPNIISKINLQIIDKLNQLGLHAEPEKITIGRHSYDIYIPECNAVIEVNPTVTHNLIANPWKDSGLDKNYHRDKTNLAREHGYTCANIWDWDVVDKVLNLFLPKQRIYARDCEVVTISSSDASKFENLYHLQGSVRSQKICLGLTYAGELVQVMTFGKPRYTDKFELELLRLCSDSKKIIIGGASKLWSVFIDKIHPSSVISYCDLSKFSGTVYEKLGMTLDHISAPNKIWSRNSESITNNLLLYHGYDQLFGTDYGKGTSNEQLMLDDGWLPVCDCGQAVYTFRK